MTSTLRALLALALVFLLFLPGCSKPEDELADHLAEIEAIMKDNMDKPADGIPALREYLRDNLPEMMELSGDLAVDLYQTDEDDIDDRAKEVSAALQGPALSLGETGQAFMAAAMSDGDSQKVIEGITKEWLSIPVLGALSGFAKDSKSSEAEMYLRMIGEGAMAFAQEEHMLEGGMSTETGLYPTGDGCTSTGAAPNKQLPIPAEFSEGPWRELRFGISKPHYYRYCYRASKDRKKFAAWADADLNGDGEVDSRFCTKGFMMSGRPELGFPMEQGPEEACGE